MTTSLGPVTIELFAAQAPVTVANFLSYVDDRFYDGTLFHRVIPDFMIQGGGYLPGLQEKQTRAPIKNEASNGLSNRRGTVAMARTDQPHSATSQFFINTADNTFLDQAECHDGVGYCVFGRVVEGMEVVDRIQAVATGSVGPHDDVPVRDVTILSVRRIEAVPASSCT
ncbi:MAG: peptidylprolyl isomerase [Gemmataceae bacterium]|nr:peptidylprolyl isomerase [Gemmataceae bacterium]MDW8266698.1 peptidylprolyl isomerase [Gemmataceae bacterium]